jgi:hypothetical protein
VGGAAVQPPHRGTRTPPWPRSSRLHRNFAETAPAVSGATRPKPKLASGTSFAPDAWKWRRQSPVGPFIVDFICLEASLVVELDGGIHAERAEYDARRDAYLKRLGLQVIRFANREVFDARDHVAWKILSACRESDPSRRGTHIPRGRRAKN